MTFKLDKEDLLLDVNNGLTLSDISKKYDMSLTTTHRRMKQFGLKPTKKKNFIKDQRFGRLLVLQEDLSNKVSSWICLCNCGKTVSVRSSHLRDNETKSCGCLAKELNWDGCNEISGNYWGQVKRHAKIRNLPMLITIQDAWQQFESQNRSCALSGLQLVFYRNPKDKSQNQTASLDRIDSNKGYEKTNIQWIHKIVQSMKMDMNETLFLDFCRKITKCNRKTLSATE